MELTSDERSFLDHLLHEMAAARDDGPAATLLKSWGLTSASVVRLKEFREQEWLERDAASGYRSGPPPLGPFLIPWPERAELLERESAARRAWERSLLDWFYRDLRQTRFIQDSYVGTLCQRRESDPRRITRQQQIIPKVLVARGVRDGALADTNDLHERLDVLLQIVDAWMDACVGIDDEELDEWLANAAELPRVTNGIVVLPGYAPKSEAARDECAGVNGWLFHANAGIPFGCQTGQNAVAFVTWAGDATIGGESIQELLDCVLRRAVDQLVQRGPALRATLASPGLLIHAVNRAMRQVAEEVWPANTGAPRIFQSN